MQTPRKLKYIDLFAGCGGLSLGLRQSGHELLLAVEKSPMAAETYFHNFVKRIVDPKDWQEYLLSGLANQVEKRLLVAPVSDLLSSQPAMDSLKSQEPDLVVGGPPCQGFSLAGRRNPSDIRNKLPWEFLEVVERTNPKMVVIENVLGMKHKFNPNENTTVFDQLQTALTDTGKGYEVQAVEVNALHFGAPQHRPRLLIIGLRKDISQTRQLFSTNNLWKSDFMGQTLQPALAPIPTETPTSVTSVGEAIADLLENPSQNSYTKLMSSAWGTIPASKVIPNHKKRTHQPKTEQRFRLYQFLSQSGVDSRILGFGSREKMEEALTACKLPAISPDGTILATTKTSLLELSWSLRTKKHSQRVLDLDKPSPTVVTIGDDYVHPLEARSFTVRELARFQGFPNGFEFRAKETTGGINRKNEVPQYSQVGNAVSPFLAKAIGELASRLLA